MSENLYLIRRAAGSPDPASEQIITLESDHWSARLLRLILPAGGVRYKVPLGRLKARVSFDGKPLQVQIRESGEEIVLYPKLQVLGLAGFQSWETERDTNRRKAASLEAATVLCANLHSHHDEQIAHLRARIDAAFVNVLGLACPGALIDGITEHTGERADEILDRVRRDVGVEIEWLLEGDRETQSWVRKLQAVLTHKNTQSFNEKSADNQFNLTYTCKIRAPIPSRHHVALRRARAGIDPQAEIARILELVHVVLDPALGIFTGNVKVWLYPNFWKLLRLAFEKRVRERVAEEFGYDVFFDDFKRERTSSEEDVTAVLENREQRQKKYRRLENERDHIHEELLAARRESGHDPEAGAVKRLEAALQKAEGEVEGARVQLERASHGRGLEQGKTDDPEALRVMTHFHNFLDLDRRDLLTLEDTK